ncbi:MAG: DUF1203 domain-containing protein [Devosiaceae bacterium]|nr:DUF1203 domain-containing protein [Devosiaceae bacterium]
MPWPSKAAIFVRHDAGQANLAINEVPQSFTTRIIAARAFGNPGMMLDADIAKGAKLVNRIERLLKLPELEYLHLHWAKFGCYAARVVRA